MKKIFTSNILKIIAFISMFLDHTGKILEIFYVNNKTISTISYIFSIIGRITFPIIIFLLIEGFNHTSSLKKYFLRVYAISLPTTFRMASRKKLLTHIWHKLCLCFWNLDGF